MTFLGKVGVDLKINYWSKEMKVNITVTEGCELKVKCENAAITITVEELYQAFKGRVAEDLLTEHGDRLSEAY